jgi:hypothetical protein
MFLPLVSDAESRDARCTGSPDIAREALISVQGKYCRKAPLREKQNNTE